MTSWIESARDMSIAEASGIAGLAYTRRGVSPCPACGVERRHAGRGDRRGAVGVSPSGKGWRCFACDASGDGIDLVSYAIGGERYRELPAHHRDRVRNLLAPGHDGGGPLPAPRLAPKPVETPEPTYPPAGEVEALWAACEPIDDAAAAYLAARQIDPVMVADADLARVLGSCVPRWARFGGRSWVETGHRVIVPMYDDTGALRSVIARRTGDAETPKSLPPAGHSRRGLIMADGLARQILAIGPALGAVRVVVTEGETDFLAAATAWSDADESAPATFGIVSGSWTAEVAARIPSDATVISAPDSDRQGEIYAQAIAGSLR